jgi:hypothetical protein
MPFAKLWTFQGEVGRAFRFPNNTWPFYLVALSDTYQAIGENVIARERNPSLGSGYGEIVSGRRTFGKDESDR